MNIEDKLKSAREELMNHINLPDHINTELLRVYIGNSEYYWNVIHKDILVYWSKENENHYFIDKQVTDVYEGDKYTIVESDSGMHLFITDNKRDKVIQIEEDLKCEHLYNPYFELLKCLGASLKKHRIKSNVTHQELFEKTGKGFSYQPSRLERVESGKIGLFIPNYIKLFKLLGFELSINFKVKKV